VIAEEHVLRARVAAVRVAFALADELDKAIRLWIRQRPEKYRIHHAEDRAVGAYADGKGEERRKRERGRSSKRPDRIPAVLNELHD
jgi:hypothetical protein